MKVAAIIAEYNPFHRGHLYHMEKTKKLTGCRHIVVVMSGHYTQRGEPAIFPPSIRARQALLNGADVVLELPALFSTASAEGFAFGALSLLHQLGVCHYLSFGSETTDQNTLEALALFLKEEPEDYKNLLQSYLKQGISFPKARNLALTNFFLQITKIDLQGSNTILALEYLRALHHFHSRIQPLAIKRIHNEYKDIHLAEEGKFSSATAIRNYLQKYHTAGLAFPKKELCQSLTSSLPASFFPTAEEETMFSPVFPKDFSLLLQYQLLRETPESLMRYEDISRELAWRIYHHRHQCREWKSFCLLLKTKEITYTRISRCLLHIILDIKKEDMAHYRARNYCPYGRILGFRKSATDLLHKMKKNSAIPLITKTARAASLLSARDFLLFEKEIMACHIYESVRSQKYQCDFQNEYTKTPMIIPL